MKAISIHGLDEPVWGALKAKARAEGKSLNATIKDILERSLGIKRTPDQHHRGEFEEFCGVWSKEEVEAFRKNTADDETVDEGDWR